MRKIYAPLIAGLVAFTFLLASPTASLAQEPEKEKYKPVGISIGGTIWYAWWRPPWEDYKTIRGVPLGTRVKIDPAILGGPMLSFKLGEKADLSAVFIYGKYSKESAYDFPLMKILFPLLNLFDIRADARRYDADLALNYRIHKYVKCIAGAKYQGYKLDLKTIKTRTIYQHSLGPGFGFGFSLPIVSTFYFLPNFTAVALGGKVAGQTIMAVGTNLTASFAYVIPKAHLTIAVGGRFQYLKFIVNDALSARDNDMFYGLTFSLVGTF